MISINCVNLPFAPDDLHLLRFPAIALHHKIELGMPVDLIGVRGSGATPARMNLMRKIKSDDKYLAGKKLIVWGFAAREFTESQGWRKVPVVK